MHSFPPGKYAFLSPITYTYPAQARGVSLVGSGVNSTVLLWPNSAGVNGLTFNMNSPSHSIRIADLTIATGGANSGTVAVRLNQTALMLAFAPSTIENVFIRGDDGGNATQYWGYGISINGVSGVTLTNVSVFGSNNAGGRGVGVSLSSASPGYGIVYSVTNSNFCWLAYGIVYAGFIQGLSVSQTNFTNGRSGIYSPVSQPGLLAQLTVSNSQFGNLSVSIGTLTPIQAVAISNNLFYVPSSGSKSAIWLDKYNSFTITGNVFEGSTNPPSGNFGISVGTPSSVPTSQHGAIVGNSFSAFSYGVYLSANARYVNVQSNSYDATSVVTPVTNVSGSATNKLGCGSL
jgi:hypothetical protein